MRKKIIFLSLAVVLIAMVLSGCSIRNYKMHAEFMNVAPSLKAVPEKFTVVLFQMDPVLDLSEGIIGFSWPAVMWDKNGKEEKLLALNTGFFTGTGQKIMSIIIPMPLEQLQDNKIAVLNRSGSVFYNHQGKSAKIIADSFWKGLNPLMWKTDPKIYGDFFTVIDKNAPYVLEVTKDSAEFEGIKKMYIEFRISDLEMVPKYVYKKYGSNLTREQLQEIAYSDSVVRNFAEWLGKDWYLYVSYPFMKIYHTALIAGVVKVIQFPSVFGDKINQPGYSEYITDADTAARISWKMLKEYGPIILKSK